MAAIYRLSHIKMFEFIVENRRNFVSLQGDSIIRFNAAMYFVLCSSQLLKFVSDLWQVDGFLQKLTATM
jgi:hypothetical protein